MSAVLVNNSLLNNLIYNLGVPIDTVIMLILIYYMSRMMHSLRCALVSFCCTLLYLYSEPRRRKKAEERLKKED